MKNLSILKEKIKNNSTIFPFIIVTILGVSALFIALHWNSINMPFERDEGEYAYSAKVLLEGGLPYRDSFMQKPPMIIYVYALARLIAPPPAVWAPRLLALLFIIGTSILTSWMAYKEFGKKIGLITLWLITVMMAFPPLLPFAANTEVFMLFPMMGAIAIYIWKKDSASFGDFLVAGFTATIALLFKPISLLVFLFLFSYWLFQIWKKTNNLKLIAKLAGSAFAGFLIAIALFLGYFIIKDGGKSFWEVVIAYNAHYFNQYGYSLDNFLYFATVFINYWTILFILLVWVLPKYDGKKLRFYMLLVLAALVLIYNNAISHYYLIIIPFLAIISAVALSYADDYLNKYLTNNFELRNSFLPKEFDFKKDPFLLTMVLLVFIILTMIWPFREQFSKTPQDLIIWNYNGSFYNPFIESPVVAKRLAELTKPQEKVFIAGSEAQILYYADRSSSSMFVITYPLSYLETTKKVDYQKAAISELKKNPPAAIVVSRCESAGFQDDSGPNLLAKFLINLLNGQYALVGGFVQESNTCQPVSPVSLVENDPNNIMGKFFVHQKDGYSDIKGHWQEPLDLKDIEKTSLLVFKKK